MRLGVTRYSDVVALGRQAGRAPAEGCVNTAKDSDRGGTVGNIHMNGSKGVVIITGASSGIGYELSRVFAREGHSLMLVARDEAKLRSVADELGEAHDISATVCPLDMAAPDAPQQLIEEIRRRQWSIDVLVNNAGFGLYGPFAEADLHSTLQMVQLNIVSLTYLTRLVLPEMIERGQGRILNVASTAAFQPGPLLAVYYASKAYVLHFSEALAEELRSTGVTVTALCPGPTETSFVDRAGLGGSKLFSGPLRVMDARMVAEAGYRGLMRKRRIIVPGLTNKFAIQSGRLLPRRLVTRVVRYIQAPKTD